MTCINPATNGARIVPFAQEDIIQFYLTGIYETVQTTLLNALNELVLKNLVEQQHLQNALNQVGQISQALQIDILNAVSVLPKDELAAMAEALVTLTSLRRHVSMSPETVGGAVDVAVISKYDGFTWIKHKSYYDPDINLHLLKQNP